MLGNSVFPTCDSEALQGEDSPETSALSSSLPAALGFASEAGALTEAEASAAHVLTTSVLPLASSGAEEG